MHGDWGEAWLESGTGMISERRVPGRGGDSFSFTFEGIEVRAWPGESVAGALAAAGQWVVRHAESGGARGFVCGIGICWECRCIIDGHPNERACMTVARPGMDVRRQEGLG